MENEDILKILKDFLDNTNGKFMGVGHILREFGERLEALESKEEK